MAAAPEVPATSPMRSPRWTRIPLVCRIRLARRLAMLAASVQQAEQVIEPAATIRAAEAQVKTYRHPRKRWRGVLALPRTLEMAVVAVTRMVLPKECQRTPRRGRAAVLIRAAVLVRTALWFRIARRARALRHDPGLAYRAQDLGGEHQASTRQVSLPQGPTRRVRLGPVPTIRRADCPAPRHELTRWFQVCATNAADGRPSSSIPPRV